MSTNGLHLISDSSIINTKKTEILTHKHNLYQQFFVISIDSKVINTINITDLKVLPEKYIEPKIISKYPNINLPYINISDSIIASHCFPNGFNNLFKEYDEKGIAIKEQKTEYFIFSLDNQYIEDKITSLILIIL